MSLLPPVGSSKKKATGGLGGLRPSDAQSLNAAKSFLDESMPSLKQFESNADALLAKLIAQQVQTIAEREQLEKSAPVEIANRLKLAKQTSESIEKLSFDLSNSIENLNQQRVVLQPIVSKLHHLISQASYIQNAGNYVRLVVHIDRMTEKIEHALHVLNQKKPYSSIIQQSIHTSLKSIQQEKESFDDKNAQKSDFSINSSKNQSTSLSTQSSTITPLHSTSLHSMPSSDFDKVSQIMNVELLNTFLQLLEFEVVLEPLKCEHLKKMLGDRVRSLGARIKAEFNNWYNATLESLQWPICMSETAQGTFNEVSLSFFRSAFTLLVKFQQAIEMAKQRNENNSKPQKSSNDAKEAKTNEKIKENENNKYSKETSIDQHQKTNSNISSSLSSTNNNNISNKSTSNADNQDLDKNSNASRLPSLWCLESLLKPLEVRFIFNFRGKESTNRFDRPEWHFTYVRNLLKNHSKFLDYVTSLLQSLGLYAYDAKHEVLKGLIILINEKSISDMNLISSLGPSANPLSRDGTKITSLQSSNSSIPYSSSSMNTSNPSSQAKTAQLSQLPLKFGSFVGNVIGVGKSNSNTSSNNNNNINIVGSNLSSEYSNLNASSNQLNASSTNQSSSIISNQHHQNLSQEMVSALLSHYINEILDFEKTLIDVYDYPITHNELQQMAPTNFPRPIDVLCIPEFYRIWLQLELKSMRDHFREALDNSDAWTRQFASVPVSDDPLRVPRHCHIFFSVLSIVQERYKLLGPGRDDLMSEFLEGQILLISDYLEELKDMQSVELRSLHGNEYISRCCSLYNAVWYCKKVLEEWGNNIFYVELYMWNQGVKDIEKLSGTVFDPILQQCKAFCKHMMKLMIDKAANMATSNMAKTYLKKNFLEERIDIIDKASAARGMEAHVKETNAKTFERINSQTTSTTIPTTSFDVSSEICDAIFLLKESFSIVENTLNTNVFHKFWTKLAFLLNDFIFDEIILKKYFNLQGAMQLKIDIEAFWVIWKSQTSLPERYFKQTADAIRILILSREEISEIAQLVQKIGRNSSSEQMRDLEQYGVVNLNASQTKQVLDRRLDK